MATATKKVRPATSPARPATTVSEPASLVLRTYQDNSGDYHWEITGENGEILAHSGSFASQGDAEHAARTMHQGARSARFEAHMAKERQAAAA